ncbi:MAG: hypothetical protein ACFFGZ_10050 [Candidatus Thorarchaeota archaeon]
MRTRSVFIVCILLYSGLYVATIPRKGATDGVWLTPQSGAAADNSEIRRLPGFFNNSSLEQDGVVARSGCERINATTNESYWEWNLAFEEYVEANLAQTIESIEGVTAVGVCLEPPFPGLDWNGTGETGVGFQLDRDVYQDQPTEGVEYGGAITDWGAQICENLTALLENKWYVVVGSVELHYEVPFGVHSSDTSDFTLDMTFMVLALLVLLIRRERRHV